MDAHQCNFNGIRAFFEALNQAGVRYLVLRNYENLLEPEMYLDGHGDLDLLCEDSDQLARVICAIPFPPKSSARENDNVHYKIYVDAQPVSLDLRQVGDGYYCEAWERDLLDRRVMNDCFYVMNDEDYFYTLTYHAILQKRTFSEEYRLRLIQMSDKLGLNVVGHNELDFINLLECHMREKGYRFCFSSDSMVPNRFHLVDKDLVNNDLSLWWRHFMFDMKVSVIELLVKIKHFLYH